MKKKKLKQLKPCPFCGNSNVGIMHFAGKAFKGVCMSANCINSFLSFTGRFYATENEAIEAWNSESVNHE